MGEVADLVKGQEDEIKQQKLEIQQMNDTIITLNKEVERLTKISEKDAQEIDQIKNDNELLDEMEAVRYQNTLLTGRLEQAKAAKTKLTKEVSSLTEIIARIKLQNDDLLNQKNMMTDKDEKVKNEVKKEDEILHNETEDSDDSLGITEEERIFFEIMEEDDESEVFKTMEEEDKGE